MKRLLQLIILLCLVSTASIAQVTWTGAGANTNWNTTDNWDTTTIPTAADDVIIPSGFTVVLNVAGSVKSIDVQGTAIFDMNTNFTFTEPSTFGANTTINWQGGTLNGTMSTLTNLGTLNLTTSANKILSGATTLENEGTLNITTNGDLYIQGAGTVINNPIGGIIDIQEDFGNIVFTIAGGVLNNAGMIKKTTSTGEAQITVILNNNNGTIQVEEGILSFQSTAKNFTDGNYNVFAGATMDWDTTINPSGSLEGTIDGDLNWNSVVNIPVGESAAFNFSADENFSWTTGTLSGGGTLTNTNVLKLVGTANKIMQGATTLENQGTLMMTSSGDLYIQGAGTVVNNPVGGVIDMQEDFGNIVFTIAGGVLNNSGLIKKTTSIGEAQITVLFNNNDGTIQVEEGILSFQSIAKNFTDGTFNVFAGATMDWDTTINPSGSLEGTIDGNLNWNSTVNVVDGTFAAFNFSADENFNWTTGNLSGGGTLTNTNVLKLVGVANKIIQGATTLENQGTLMMTSAGDLYIQGAGTIVNNPVGGVIDMQEDQGNIVYSIAGGALNNSGMIKKTTSAGEAVISVLLNNNDGTIQVEEGILSFQSIAKNFTDGTFNVFAGATMDWDTTINPSGSLEGTIEGDLNWNSTVNVVDGTFAAFNFSEADNFNWTTGNLSGGGTLTNTNVLKLVGVANKIIQGATTLENQGTLMVTSSGDLYIQGVDNELNNAVSGTIDMQEDQGNIIFSVAGSIINNAGLIKRTTSTGTAIITVPLNNSGTIEVVSGELEIGNSTPFTNEETGIVKGIGVFDLPTVANYTNNGTFAPGLSPGVLSIQGDYKSSSSSVLDIELDGLVQGTEYDLLAITGTNVIFDGSVNITMGFDAEIGNTFTIATTTGTIATQNLATPVIADHEGKRYTFDITYPGNNQVLLTISDKLDIQAPDVLTQNITVQLDASGNASITEAQIDNGSSDNCTLTPNLVFALDVTDFDCEDVGPNTVTLTVIDEAANAANATAIVTVEDNIDPEVTCPVDIVQTNDPGSCGAVVVFMASSTDNCSGVSTSSVPVSGSVFPVGTTLVTVTATDASGNTDICTFNVTINDNEDPDIVCPIGFTEVSDGPFAIPDYYLNGTVTASDNCSIASVVQTPTAGTILPDGDYDVNFVITDGSGNMNSCMFELKVEDSSLSVEDYELSEKDIKLFPNPVIDYITIQNNSNVELVSAMIIDMKGSTIKTIDLKGNSQKQISLSALSTGMYFMKIQSDNGVITKRLIKK